MNLRGLKRQHPDLRLATCDWRRRVLAIGFSLAAVLLPSKSLVHAQTDLDAFMQQVLARRDDNWKKLQQYILDEREQIELRAAGRVPLWGERREYTWYIRDGYFVRSPVRFNGVEVGEAERRRAETEFLRRSQERDKGLSRQSQVASPQSSAVSPPSESPVDSRQSDASAAESGSASIDGLLRQVREPQFVSSAYFLRFKFEEGTYALVGRETLDDRDVLRIEYYPTNLYSQNQRRRQARSHDPRDPRDAEVQRMLNKVALVTLWIDPSSHQIVKYTFDNIDFDFLPAQWLVRIDTVRASMTMGQPFPGVWLPRGLEMSIAVSLAAGSFDVRYALDYHDYKLADVATKILVNPDH